MIGTEFDYRHAAGTTRYRVDRQHRDAGYWECVATKAVSGTHTFIGGIDVFSTSEIKYAQKYPESAS